MEETDILDELLQGDEPTNSDEQTVEEAQPEHNTSVDSTSKPFEAHEAEDGRKIITDLGDYETRI